MTERDQQPLTDEQMNELVYADVNDPTAYPADPNIPPHVCIVVHARDAWQRLGVADAA